MSSQAVHSPVDAAGFLDAIATCADGDTVQLGDDITIADEISTACDLTLDVAGRQLVVNAIRIGAGSHLTIDNSSASSGGVSAVSPAGSTAGITTQGASLTINGGTVEAVGEYSSAGIGGNSGQAGGTVVINGGTVDARGGSQAAGIGGGGWGASGTIHITGGVVRAQGGMHGAGIGSGYNRAADNIVVTGGTITATGGASGGAGIGAGNYGDLVNVTIGGHAVVTARSDTGAGIGAGVEAVRSGVGPHVVLGGDAVITSQSDSGNAISANHWNSGAGATIVISDRADVTALSNSQPALGNHLPSSIVRIDGTLRTSDVVDVSRTAITVGSTGRLIGLVGSESTGPVITGSGQINNQGTIVPTSVESTVSVTGHHHRVSFDLNGGIGPADPITFFAPSLAAAHKSLPTPTHASHAFGGWLRNGEPFDENSQLLATATGAPNEVPLTATWLVADAAGLSHALSACTDDVVIVGGDIVAAASLVVACDVTLDLNGHSVSVHDVNIIDAKTFTIDDSASGGTFAAQAVAGESPGIRVENGATFVVEGGEVRADSTGHAAGIGSGMGGATGTIIINGGMVVADARGTGGAAGIGGGYESTAPMILINGGTVTATGSNNGPGIGGGSFGEIGTITISGGTVTASTRGTAGAGIGGAWVSRGGVITISGGTISATGAHGAAAIGAGYQASSFGSVTIGAGAEVTARAESSHGSTAVGVGDSSPAQVRGTVQVSGLLRVLSGEIHVNRNDLTIGATGSILGGSGDPTAGPAFVGPGTVQNDGVIASTNVANTVSVLGHHFDVVAETGTVRVYGPSLAAGYRSMPAAPTRGIDEFAGWHMDGADFTAATLLPGESTDGDPVVVDLTATWNEGAVEISPSGPVSFTAGDAVTLHPTLIDAAGAPVSTVGADWTWTTPASLSVSPVVDGWAITGTVPGTSTVTASITRQGRTYSADLLVTVSAGSVASMDVSYTGDTTAGGSITLSVAGEDAYGNDLGDVTGAVTFTSSVASDVVAGDDVSFTEAGTRTITATHADGATETLDVTVAAGPVASMDVTYTGSATAGGTITLTATGEDTYGNDLGDVTGAVMISSSEASDVINGDEVSFTAAGARTLTVSHLNGTTATLDVTVAAGPVDSLDVSYTGSTTAGGSITLSVAGEDEFGNDLGNVTGDVTFTSSEASDVVDGDEVTFTESGGRTITATHANGTTATLNVTVVAGPVDSLDVTYTGDTTAGGSITLAATGEDAYGNDLGDVTGAVTFTSSVALDVVNGAVVSFTEAGTRTITATHVDGATETLDVTVVAGPVDSMDVTHTGDTTAGGTITVTVTSADSYGNDAGDVTDAVVISSSEDTDVIGGDEVSFTVAGARTLTVTHLNGTTTSVSVTVEAGSVSSMDMKYTGEAKAGGTIAFTVTGEDAFGNDLGDVTGDVVLTSSVASDVIVGNTVTFPTASPHTITATHSSGVTASLVVEVEAAPVSRAPERPGVSPSERAAALPATGISASLWWLVAALTAVATGARLVTRRRG